MIVEVKGPIIGNDEKWIYDWIGWDSTCPKDLKNALEQASGEEITLVINSGGGLVVSGTEMYQMLKSYPGKVTAHVVTACSAATIIACGADEVLISKVGLYMIHNASGHASGDYRDMGKESNILKKLNKVIIGAYTEKTGMSEDRLQSLMDKESWMPAKEAITYGFCDGYIDSKSTQAKEDETDILTRAAASAYNMLPCDKVAEIKMALETKETSNKQKACNSASSDIKEGSKKMTLEELLNEYPEAKAEYDKHISEAKAEGEKKTEDNEKLIMAAVNAENERLKSLDAIAGMISVESLNEAKYGKEKIDGKELAYRAAVAGELKAQAYLTNALEDAKNSGTNALGIGEPDTGIIQNDDADKMASYINERKGA